MSLRDKTNISLARLHIKRARRTRVFGMGALCILTLFTILAVFPVVNHKEEAEATIVPATTTLAIVSSKDTASVDITPTSSAGTFATSSAADQAEFTVTTDNLTGYSVTLLGTDTSGQLVNAASGDTLDTIASDTTESDFINGSASTYTNKWGYRLNINGTTTTDFMAAPTTSTAKTIYSTTSPNTAGTPDNYTLALGARVDYTKPAGTYTNTFVLTAVGNPISYQINYDDTTSDPSVSGIPASEGQANVTASEFILDTAVPTRTNYVFIGWCYGDVTNSSSSNSTCAAGAAGGDGTVYQPGDTFTFTTLSSGSTVTANLHAMWGIPIQNLTVSMCTATPKTVYDIRDRKKYTVARLNDGNCWMTSSLNLAGGTVLNANDSDVPTNGYYTLPASSTTGFDSDTGEYVYNSGNETTNQADCTSSQACNSYYSWLAATAGGKDASGAAVTGDGYNAAYSICPKGWRLPTATTSNASATTSPNWKTGDYYRLATAYGANLESSYFENSATFYNNAGPGTTPNYLFAGHYANSIFSGGGLNGGGYYWSPSLRSSEYAYYFYSTSSAVYSANYTGRRQGISVRCILDPTMQDFQVADVNAMAVGDTVALKDVRDNQVYKVAKLADGNVWLIENLRLDLTDATVKTNLTPITTNATDAALVNLKNNVTTSWTNTYTAPVINTTYKNTTQAASGSAPAGKIGVYYNYCAASAGSYCYASNAGSGNAQYDICPAGWRMPTGGASGEYQALYTAYSSNAANFEAALSTPLSGYLRSGSANAQGTNGYFWSSTINDTNNMYALYVYASSVRPQVGDARYDGFSVRCVKETRTIADITNMQDITPAIAHSTPEGATKAGGLIDTRDGSSYTVKKIAGFLWMTQNLRLAGGTTITNTNSNISSSSYELPADTASFPGSSDWTTAAVHCSGNTTTGCWYNYVAATAGTITGSSNANTAQYDICPAGWKLPGTQGSAAINQQFEQIISRKTDFNPVAGGYMGSSTTPQSPTYGYWWSSIAADATRRYDLHYNGTNLSIINNGRQNGFFVRCVAK